MGKFIDKTKATLALKLKGIIQCFDFRSKFTKYRLSSDKILSYLFNWSCSMKYLNSTRHTDHLIRYFDCWFVFYSMPSNHLIKRILLKISWPSLGQATQSTEPTNYSSCWLQFTFWLNRVCHGLNSLIYKCLFAHLYLYPRWCYLPAV